MDVDPKSTSQMDFIEQGVIVKGETEALEGIFFEPEKKIVEQEIKRRLTPTPEEFAGSEQDSTQRNKGKALSKYKIRKALLDKQLCRKYHSLYMCPSCFERKKLRLIRVNKNGDRPGVADYILLCDSCRKKRQEEQKKTKLWSRGPGVKGGSPENSKTAFFNSIRALVFARDGAECPYCGSKENLGLAALMPLSRGGKLCFDNYTVSCQKCRGARSGSKYSKPMTPLEYFWQEEGLKSYLSESLDYGVTTQNPGATIRMNVHLWGRYEKLLAMMRVCKSLEELAKIRNTAETLHIEFCKTDEDRRREREQLPW